MLCSSCELVAIEAESIGWLPLGEGAYLHVGDPEGDVITVVGVPCRPANADFL